MRTWVRSDYFPLISSNFAILSKLCDFWWIMRKVAIWGQLCEIATSQNIRSPVIVNFTSFWESLTYCNETVYFGSLSNVSLLSLSYLLQCRYISVSRMCLVENAQHEKVFAYIQSGFVRIKPRVNCFVLENLIVSSKNLCSRPLKNSSSVSKLETLDPQKSKLEPRN